MDKKMYPHDAWELVKPFVYTEVKSPGEITEEVKNAAIFLIEHELSLFKNEQFCIAVCCQLELEIQRKTAWFLVSEMLNGNFSWITRPSSFSVEKALFQAGIIPENYFHNEKIRNAAFQCFRYIFENSELLKSIIEKFNLPTHRLHPDKILTAKEKAERNEFNFCYYCGIGGGVPVL